MSMMQYRAKGRTRYLREIVIPRNADIYTPAKAIGQIKFDGISEAQAAAIEAIYADADLRVAIVIVGR